MSNLSGKINLPKLNLPSIKPQLNKVENLIYIWDDIRKKDLVLTPEEWVRQHWIHFLIDSYDYPKGLFSLEKGLKYNRLQKRTDLVVLNTDGHPYLLIECKAPNVKINQRTMEQAAVYHRELHSDYLILSNGINHVILKWKEELNTFEQLKEIPVTPKK